jgi:DNA repair exonuclease SbcCD ATPase subunit
LRNPLYIGRIKWGEAFKDDCHEPLICKEQFERVQRVLGETTKHRRNHQSTRGRSYLLRELIRCGCGAQMTPAGAHGHGGKYHYYVCTRQVHEGGKVSCQAPRFPAEALEIAVLERIRVLAAMKEARDRIVQEALKVIAEESTRVQGEEEILRRQLGRVRGDIGRLVGVLKTLGTSGLKSVQEELSRLEQEERGLDEQLQEVSKRKDPLDQISSQARQFVENVEERGAAAGPGGRRGTASHPPALCRGDRASGHGQQGEDRHLRPPTFPRGSAVHVPG